MGGWGIERTGEMRYMGSGVFLYKGNKLRKKGAQISKLEKVFFDIRYVKDGEEKSLTWNLEAEPSGVLLYKPGRDVYEETDFFRAGHQERPPP